MTAPDLTPNVGADKIARLVDATRMGLMPSAARFMSAYREDERTIEDCEYRLKESAKRLDDAWRELDMALSLTALGELDREAVIVALMGGH